MGNLPDRITVDCRLRPIRLAFLVKPNDRDTLQRVFEVNTCLWGGCFNPIIPAFKQTPSWWDSKHSRPPARDIVRGYIDAFEPDFIVADDDSYLDGAGYPASRVVTLIDILDPTRNEHVGYGISVNDVYLELYQKAHQFLHRFPSKFCLPIVKKREQALFASAVCGRFPDELELSYLIRNFETAFDASMLEICESSYADVVAGKIRTPLWVGKQLLNIQRFGWRNEPLIYLMDIAKERDLIDYWNLRALGRRTIPIPIQWQENLAESIKEIIDKQCRSNRRNQEFPGRTAILASRSLKKDELNTFISRLALPTNDRLIATGYPRIWDDWARRHDGVSRCSVEGGRHEDDYRVDDGRIIAKLATPPFKTNVGLHDGPLWSNVITFKTFHHGDELADHIPPDLPKLDRIFDTMHFTDESTFISSEGVVYFATYASDVLFWRLADGITIFKKWFESKGFDANLSGAGKVCLQVIRQLGGVLGAVALVNGDILKELNKMSHGLIETDIEEADSLKTGRKAHSRAISFHSFFGLMKRVHSNEHRANHELSRLAERGVIRIGAKLQCPRCSQMNWFSLDDLSDSVRCERCLETFPFPASKPPREPWAFRTQGPFSIENYAQGSYCVALTLRFLILYTHEYNSTWAPSMTLRDENGEISEVDFAIWCRSRNFTSNKVLLFLGECKSFSEKFGSNEIQKAKALAKKFPESVTVFATLRPELTKVEKDQIARIALAGRRRTKADNWRNPVLVLTATELLSMHGPTSCWSDAGERIRGIGQNIRSHTDFIELCDATQQMHLGMKSDAATYREYLDSLDNKRRKRQPQEKQDISEEQNS